MKHKVGKTNYENKEELNQLWQEFKTLINQFYELTDDELEMVVGGLANETKVTISENGKVTIENAL